MDYNRGDTHVHNRNHFDDIGAAVTVEVVEINFEIMHPDGLFYETVPSDREEDLKVKRSFTPPSHKIAIKTSQRNDICEQM
ncbi:Hypothetical predicted protein [Octopus vulgaris]|uniref:Uncharacterized protein n=1 Tax=Octopus vulgaris TaxID=6645 RepID=A0AA36B8Q2_OCTVU|nr:Hypothetical predicted protein [Octopus vulgaris]